MEAERPPARAVTQRKTVTFVRHGVAAHNFHGVQDPHPDEPARYTDSPLTDYGRAQAAAASHYEDPSAGPCQAGELAVRIQGVQGGFCSPDCSSGPCPTDVPAATTASPECALETQGASKPSRCALICESSSKCPAKASCKMVQGAIGLCTYDS